MPIVPQLSLPLLDEGKTCTACLVWKPFSEYYRHTGQKLRNDCKRCTAGKSRAYHNSHKEEIHLRMNAYSKEYCKNNREST